MKTVLHPSSSRTGSSRALLAAACVLLASASLAAAPSSSPFYYYQGQPVPLEIDPERIVVSSDSEPEPTARSLLSTEGLSLSGMERTRQSPDHWVMRLPRGTSRGSAEAALRRLRRDGNFRFVSHAYRTADAGHDVLLLDRVIVRFKEGVTRSQIDQLNAQLGTRILREPAPAEGRLDWLLSYPRRPGVEPLDVAAQLDRHPLVAWADPDKVSDRTLHRVPNDPLYPQQYYLNNTATLNGVRVDIDAQNAWDFSLGGWAPSSGQTLNVAVIDDGVESTHELGFSPMWGYDAFGNSGFGCSGCYMNPQPNDSHGTHVAGVIGAAFDNGTGVAGIAPAAHIVPVRIFNNGVAASDSAIASAINYAWSNAYGSGNAHVLSNSWGGGASSNAITNAINSATTQGRGGKGSLVVFSAGNTSARSSGIIGGVTYPGTLDSVVTVSAINRNGGLANYSPEGSAIDIVAPSGHTTGHCTGDIVTLDLLGYDGCNDGPGGNIDYSSSFSGTSAAAPQVSAVGALLIAREPSLTLAQIKSRLYSGADPWGPATQFGAGKLNAFRTLIPRLTVSISGPTGVITPGAYTWTANPSGGVPPYSYNWEMSWDGINYFGAGSSQSYSEYVYAGDVFWLRVTVTATSGTEQKSAVRKVTGPPNCDARQGIIICPVQ